MNDNPSQQNVSPVNKGVIRMNQISVLQTASKQNRTTNHIFLTGEADVCINIL